MLPMHMLLRTDARFPYAHHTMHTRLPGNIRDILTLNPDYPARIRDAVQRLHDSIVSDAVMPMIERPAQDYARWTEWFAPHAGESWLQSEWFFAETFAYRHVVDAVRYYETGRDPFAPRKAEEFASSALWNTLQAALETRGLPQEERLKALIEYDLWGNRIDLSHAMAMAHGAEAASEDLLAEDTLAAVEHLLRARGVVHFICDNCGTELAMDCALADGLLELGHDVWLHVKPHPFYVSDTIVADVHGFLRLAADRGGDAAALGARLAAAFESGRLRVLTDTFWTGTDFLNRLPAYLHETFAEAALVIVKGDLNYRRTIVDMVRPATTPFAEVTAYFPAPLLALRTLKSDPIVGLAPGRAEALDAEDAEWRVNGRRGVIQFKP